MAKIRDLAVCTPTPERKAIIAVPLREHRAPGDYCALRPLSASRTWRHSNSLEYSLSPSPAKRLSSDTAPQELSPDGNASLLLSVSAGAGSLLENSGLGSLLDHSGLISDQ